MSQLARSELTGMGFKGHLTDAMLLAPVTQVCVELYDWDNAPCSPSLASAYSDGRVAMNGIAASGIVRPIPELQGIAVVSPDVHEWVAEREDMSVGDLIEQARQYASERAQTPASLPHAA